MLIKRSLSHAGDEILDQQLATRKDVPSVSIIIPVYNEEKRIERGLSRTLAFCEFAGWDFEIIVASEGSTDGTVELVERKFPQSEKIKLLTGERRLGKGGSIKNAVKAVSKEYLAYMDIDLSADPSEFDRLLAHSDGSDIVIGSRILRGDLPSVTRPLTRALFSHLYSLSFRIMFLTNIRDPQCGFKLFRKDFAEALFSDISTDGFAFDTEVIARAVSLGARIKEVPITWSHQMHSKISIPQQVVSMGIGLVSIRYRTLMM